MPVDIANGYHIERWVAVSSQHRYSESGATKKVLEEIMDEMIRICEDDKIKTVRTNIAVLANNIKTRLKYPIDEDCAIRTGALLTFIENEDPNKVDEFFTNKKIQLAHSNPEAYTFFLTTGLEFTKSYREQSDILIDTDYFRNRRTMLAGLLPA